MTRDALPDDWLTGTPMDPAATPADPLPAIPGLPFAHQGTAVLIVGPTGGGRSSLAEAVLYDSTSHGLRSAYLGSEVTEPEFNARAALLARHRDEPITTPLQKRLAAVRYLDLATTLTAAWHNAAQWVTGITALYDLLVVDPLAAAASAVDLDFEQGNEPFNRFYDRLIAPITARGVTVLLLDNIGHNPDAKARAKGASAKEQRADIALACRLTGTPPGLAIEARKVRSARAPFTRGHEWLFHKDSQHITDRGATRPEDAPPFRPTGLMQRVSEALERDTGLSTNAICTAVKGKREYILLAIQLLTAEGYVAAAQDGRQTIRHELTKPYRETDDTTGSQPVPNQFPEPAGDTGTTGSHPLRGGTGTGTGHPQHNGNPNQFPLEATT
jgi:hypothetical protein